jgi:hypothetical protein
MTEAEWRECLKPDTMLRDLQRRFSRHECRRKLRLYLCGCCRLGRDLIPLPVTRDFLEIIERFVDGDASREETNATMYFLKVGVKPRSSDPS